MSVSLQNAVITRGFSHLVKQNFGFEVTNISEVNGLSCHIQIVKILTVLKLLKGLSSTY